MAAKGRLEREFSPGVPPLVPVTVRAPGAAGASVSGLAVIDSAADVSCIREDVAAELSLTKIHETGLRGTTGKAQRPIFQCAIDLGTLDALPTWPVISIPAGIRDVVLIVGRDLMHRWVTTFDGQRRKLVIRRP